MYRRKKRARTPEEADALLKYSAKSPQTYTPPRGAGDPGRQHPGANYQRRSPLEPGPIPVTVAAATVVLAAATIAG